MENFIRNWLNVSMGGQGRLDLEASDKKWEEIYEILLKNNDDEYIVSDSLLFRVHTGGKKEPIYENYSDHVNQSEVFKEVHDFWIKQNDINAIEYHNHWLSFTDSVEVINSDYFAEKHLRGFVIVINPKKAIKIGELKRGNDEREVVAPMDKSTVVEVLKFDDFLKKYT